MNFPAALFRVALTLALAAALFAVASCESRSRATPAAPRGAATVPVTLKPVKLLPVQRTVDVVGTLFGDEETVISAKVPGRIVKLYKDVGDRVDPGEPLVQLKPNDYQLNVAKARLAMEQVLAKLGLSELPTSDFDITKVPTVVKARLQAENAEGRFNRGKKLFEAKPAPLLSEQEFADLETALRVARAAYDVELLSAKALVAEARALEGDLDIAEQRLADATTRAPSPPNPKDIEASAATQPVRRHQYVVTARMVNEGELVREITPCFKLVDDNPIKLRAKVPERFVADIRGGESVSVQIEAYPTEVFKGFVSRVNPQIDQDNRTFGIEVLIDNSDHRLKSGAFARAAVNTRIDPRVVFAPQEAIVSFAGVNKVFAVDDKSKAVELTVDPGEARSGEKNETYVEILSGLKGDEKLVVSGTSKLATGVPVVLKQPSSTLSTRPVK